MLSFLASIATTKDAWVLDVSEEVVGNGHGNPCFLRHFHDWKIESGKFFLEQLSKVAILREQEDGLEKRCAKDEKSMLNLSIPYTL